MIRKFQLIVTALMAVLLLSGCTMPTVDQLYTPPKRSAEYEDLQRAIDIAMTGMTYSSPLSGENRQTVQMADLDGDGSDEYLLFAMDDSEKPLKVLIFDRGEDGCVLTETIEGHGLGFDLVEYAQLDGAPGMELIVGQRLSESVLRSATVYTFRQGSAQQILNISYSKLVLTDLDSNHLTELMVISSGETEQEHAVAALYSYCDGTMARSKEASLSESTGNIKRIMTGELHDNIPAVYVASGVADNAIITDVFTLKNGEFTNVSFSNESGTSVKTLRNYYVYADDIDQDGVLELPELIDMKPVENTWMASNQKLIRWYAMDIDGNEIEKMYTFHNFDGGWYLQLDKFLTPRISVIQSDGSFVFYLWGEDFLDANVLMTVHTLSGNNREEEAARLGYSILYKTDNLLYAVETEMIALELGLIPELLAASFHPIQTDWKNGET